MILRNHFHDYRSPDCTFKSVDWIEILHIDQKLNDQAWQFLKERDDKIQMSNQIISIFFYFEIFLNLTNLVSGRVNAAKRFSPERKTRYSAGAEMV